jgi:uncharacterized MAPEG superfamily protein
MPTPYVLLPTNLPITFHFTTDILQVALIKKSTHKWDNLNPRGIDTIASYQKSVPADCYAKFEKAEAAHKNGLENAPLFIGAVLAGNVAGLDNCEHFHCLRRWKVEALIRLPATMNAVSGSYLALRVLYTVLYMKCTRQETSKLRSLTWVVSIILLTGLYFKAGNAWAAKG